MSTTPDIDFTPFAHPDTMQLVESDLTIDHDAAGAPVMDPTYSAAKALLSKFHDGGTTLADAEAQLRARDGVQLNPIDADRLRRTADKTLGNLRKQTDATLDTIAQRRERVENDIAAALQLPEHRTSIVHAQRSADVRAALRAMGQTERQDAVNAALGAGDVEAIAAVLSASPLASGLSRDDFKRLQSAAEIQFAPRLVTIRAALDKTRDIVTRVDDVTNSRFAGLLGADTSTPAGRAEAALRRAELIGGAN